MQERIGMHPLVTKKAISNKLGSAYGSKTNYMPNTPYAE
jgi:hypothetical protein